jgi:hypothetical protein
MERVAKDVRPIIFSLIRKLLHRRFFWLLTLNNAAVVS